ncbi:MAG: aldo/keto reductase [Solirubrobacterales bacterium]|nr:aldo/keto reductase [Solirubrobacterales bacterium]
MRQLTLPGSDLHVSSLCLGTGQFGSGIGQEMSWRLLDAFVEAGGTFVDSANVYGDWVPGAKSSSEKMIGAWLAARGLRDRIVLATKGGHPRLDRMDVPRLAPADLIHDVDESLAHLQTDRIDLYWLHRDDPARPVDEIMQTLAGLIAAGKIRYVGCSNWRADRIRAAQESAAANQLPGFVGNQMMWSLAALNPDGLADPSLVSMTPDLCRYHLESGLAAVPYSSQANGLFQKLSHWWTRRGISPNQAARYPLAENQARLARAPSLARDLGVSLTGIVLGYLQSHPFVTVPIVGCRTLDQLADSLAGDGVRLTPGQLTFLESGTP